MKSSKLLSMIIVLIMMINLVSCNHSHSGNANKNPQNNPSTETPNEQKITYIYSVTEKRLHLPTCFHVGNMNEDYKFEYSGDISILLAKGYTICKDCLYENHEEEKEEVREPDPDEVPFEEATYVINRSKLTIHEKDCYNVKKIAEKNLKYTNLSIEELLENEHVPCGNCLPKEYEAYKEAHPEKFPDDDKQVDLCRAIYFARHIF